MKTPDLLALGPVIPVIVIDDLESAVPLARALVSGGIRVLEVTLRTKVALEAIRTISREVPDALVGAGTILNVQDLQLARDAGAKFGVSPGTLPQLLAEARDAAWPYLPGVTTSSDIMSALEQGYQELKFFPAAQAGGIPMLKAFSGPFPQITFCPTGGIQPGTAAEYLALPNVACVGGSWLTPAALVKERNWQEITYLARRATALPR
jgi:2-dehydro-3-deoxyphosphogluconate aldolase/(4S)-4-hydroxy-2-oxoglutarate aldolase